MKKSYHLDIVFQLVLVIVAKTENLGFPYHSYNGEIHFYVL